jgi:hypothetical protein
MVFSFSQLYSERYFEIFPAQPSQEVAKKILIDLVGWGPDGLLAYTEEIQESWHPYNFTKRFVIYSLVTDKVICQDKFEIHPDDPMGYGWDDADVLDFKIGSWFEQEMKERGIIKEATRLESFPYENEVSGEKIGMFLEIDDFQLKKGFCTKYYDYSYKIYATKEGLKKKISQGSKEQVIYQSIQGYLKHPREDRIAVIVATYIVYKGCVSLIHTEIIGCHTQKGYK